MDTIKKFFKRFKCLGGCTSDTSDPARRLLLFLVGYLAFALTLIVTLLTALLDPAFFTPVYYVPAFCPPAFCFPVYLETTKTISLYQNALRDLAFFSGLAVATAFVVQWFYVYINKYPLLCNLVYLVVFIGVCLSLYVIIDPFCSGNCFNDVTLSKTLANALRRPNLTTFQ